MSDGIHILCLVMIIIANEISESSQSTKINLETCGRSLRPFVVGGKNATENEFPFIVSLQLEISSGRWMHFCGGTILNERWVLTATHCIDLPSEISIGRIRIVAGTNDQKNPHKVYSVHRIVANGCFYKRELDDDIALLKTNEYIEIDNKKIGTICLPPKRKGPVNTKAQVAGWGVWKETNVFQEIELGPEATSRFLQKADIELKPEDYCEHHIYFRNLGIADGPPKWTLGKRLCMQSLQSTVCRGDSGGPAFQKVDGRYYQIGVASFISIQFIDNTCYKSNPVVYVETSKYRDWIESSIVRYDMSEEEKVKTECF